MTELVGPGRGFIVWLLFHALARVIGWVGAMAVIALVILVPLIARWWRQR